MSNWNDFFWLTMAQHYSAQSKDPSTKVGAVIVRPDGTAASFGTNGFPQRIVDDPVRLADRAWKYPLTVHAEMNALLFMREPGAGYTLYSTFAPCFEKCAAPIIQAGIGAVVYFEGDPRSPVVCDADRHGWDIGQDRAKRLFLEAGMEVRTLARDGKGGTVSRRNVTRPYPAEPMGPGPIDVEIGFVYRDQIAT